MEQAAAVPREVREELVEKSVEIGQAMGLLREAAGDAAGPAVVGHWTPVTESMPDDEITVLVWMGSMEDATLAYHDSGVLERRGDSGWTMAETVTPGRVLLDVTHWCAEICPPPARAMTPAPQTAHPWAQPTKIGDTGLAAATMRSHEALLRVCDLLVAWKTTLKNRNGITWDAIDAGDTQRLKMSIDHLEAAISPPHAPALAPAPESP